MLEAFLDQTIADISIPGLENPYKGKVRQSYDAPENRKIIIATDRLSAFDRQITTIPLKGQVLTQLARYWFDQTGDICQNHVIAYPDPNVVVCKKLNMLPVEIVVRGYLAGSTATSILKLYKTGKREMYGIVFPDGLQDNQKLDRPIITPTTKAAINEHDAPLSPDEIVTKGILDKNIWEKATAYALALFKRGQKIALERGLILVDTKYEFGLSTDGTLVLGDEIHTPDSSRYWIAATYAERQAEGKPPDALDKDIVRRWLTDHCDPYGADIPAIPDEVRLATSKAYISAYEQMTGKPLDYPDPKIPPEKRIEKAVRDYLAL